MNRLRLERWYPFIGAGIAAATWSYFGLSLCPPLAVHDIFANTLSIAAITVGFLATAMSIVVAAPDSPLIRELARSNYLSDLVRYLKEPFLVGIAIASFCLAGFVATESVTSHVAFGATWAFLAVWMLLGLFRIGTLFVRLIELIGKRSLDKPRRTRTLQEIGSDGEP